MIQGPDPGSVYKLPDNRVTTIGRSSQNTITIVVRAVSRFHAEVACVNGRWELTDLNSRRGTMVNNEWVKGRVQIEFGDIIRFSSVVLRFDNYDERVAEQGALLAIKEAELNKKLVKKGEAELDLEDIMLRSRMESQSRLQERVAARVEKRTNKAFLTALAIGVTGLLGITLAWAHGFIPGLEGLAAAPVCNEPVAANTPEANVPVPVVPTIEELMAERESEQRREAELWARVQASHEAVLAAHRTGNFAAALKALQELPTDELTDPMKAHVAEDQAFTEKLAQAHFAEQRTAAEQLVAEGRGRDAARVYEGLADRVGVPELAAQARKRASELNTNGR